ncbi:WxL protein peptidoglycan domain-containing protein [Microbacterium sp. P06]|uniref:WxL protein peptidoglycan domain-containing protein n=1 Tax=Microbacterium sp. P06 TaxID=3366949 RepID=UPI003745872F
MTRTPRRSFRAFAGAALVAALAFSPLVVSQTATAATAEPPTDTDVTWGVRTAENAQGAARQNFAYTVSPGGRLDDALVISNHDDAPLDLDIYGADAFTTQSGQLDVLPRAEESAFLGTWITVGQGRVSIPAGESVEVPFTVAVPANATPGDYAGGIVSSLPQPEQSDGIAVDRRLGIRVQLRVEGDLMPGLAVENVTVEYAPTLNPFGPGAATVDYTVRNTGNTRLTAQQSVALSGPFGLLRSDIAGVEPVPELLPGESWTVSAHTDAYVPLFWMNVDITLAPAGPAGFDGAGDPPMFVTTAGTLAIPWAQLVLLVVLAGSVVLIVRTVRRSRRRRKAAEEARVKAAVEEALKTRE